MKSDELIELSKLARQDGRRLFAVTETLHRIGLIGPILIGILGLIGGFAAISNSGIGAGLFVFIVAGLISWIMYLGVILTTSFMKVIVHSMFCTLGALEAVSEEKKNII
jgi:hypothetical protein